LSGLRSWYRLTDLRKTGDPEFQVVASLNPARTVTPGYVEADDVPQAGYKVYRDYLKPQPDPDLPSPRVPAFADNVLARNFKAEYINKKFAEKNGRTSDHAEKIRGTIGFRHINKYDLNTDASRSWVRMHLLTEKLGGPALGSNLVPARNVINNPTFKRGIEQYPEDEIRRDDPSRGDRLRMIWYKINLTYHAGPVKGFPHSITAEWGTYDYDPTAKRWSETRPVDGRPTALSVGPLEKPPQPQGRSSKSFVNYDSIPRMRRMLGIGKPFARAIVAARTNDGTGSRAPKMPGNVVELTQRLHNINSRRERKIRGFAEGMAALGVAEQEQHLDFGAP
jgi:hypothetical protein